MSESRRSRTALFTAVTAPRPRPHSELRCGAGTSSGPSPQTGKEKDTARARSWSELSSRQKLAVTLSISAQLSPAAYAWRDLAQRPAEEVNGSKRMWAAIIAINFIGPVAYFMRGRRAIPAPD